MAWTKTQPAVTETADTSAGAIRGLVSVDASTGHVLIEVTIPTDAGTVVRVPVDCDATLSAADLATFKGLLGQLRNKALTAAGFVNA